jgi:hypothetical protein
MRPLLQPPHRIEPVMDTVHLAALPREMYPHSLAQIKVVFY